MSTEQPAVAPLNLFATVLTFPAPTANYRGESELNRTVIQKVTDGRHVYPIKSPEAMRNALREILRKYGLPMNRERLHDEEQISVRYHHYPDPERFADDHLFGYLIAEGDHIQFLRKIVDDADDPRGENVKAKLVELEKEDKKKGKDKAKMIRLRQEIMAALPFRFKRDSVLRMNLAKGLEVYRHDTVFTQSPRASEDSKYRNAENVQLLHRETAVTAFQYPFALAGVDCRSRPDWVRALLKAIGELSGVAGNHARSYYEMAPASLSVRLTPMLVAGHDTYHFRLDGRGPDNERRIGSSLLRDLVDDELKLPGDEFFLGGEMVRDLKREHESEVHQWDKRPEEKRQGGRPKTRYERLRDGRVTLDADPRRLLDIVAERFLGGER